MGAGQKCTAKEKASEEGASRYFTGIACKNGHISDRYTVNGDCVECVFLRIKKNASKDVVRQKAREDGWVTYPSKACRYNHAPRRYTASGRCVECARLAKIALCDEKKAIERQKNTERMRRAIKKPATREVLAAKAMRQRVRMSDLCNATPKWLTPGHIAEMFGVYHFASILRMTVGKIDVDHIAPLRGEDSSGLHVPWNLRVILKSDNCSKSNNVHLDLITSGIVCSPIDTSGKIAKLKISNGG